METEPQESDNDSISNTGSFLDLGNEGLRRTSRQQQVQEEVLSEELQEEPHEDTHEVHDLPGSPFIEDSANRRRVASESNESDPEVVENVVPQRFHPNEKKKRKVVQPAYEEMEERQAATRQKRRRDNVREHDRSLCRPYKPYNDLLILFRSTDSPDTADERYSRRRKSGAQASSKSRSNVFDYEVNFDRLRERALIRGPSHARVPPIQEAEIRREEEERRMLNQRISPHTHDDSSPSTDDEAYKRPPGREKGKEKDRNQLSRAIMSEFKKRK
jgi:hypothetical protein